MRKRFQVFLTNGKVIFMTPDEKIKIDRIKDSLSKIMKSNYLCTMQTDDDFLVVKSNQIAAILCSGLTDGEDDLELGDDDDDDFSDELDGSEFSIEKIDEDSNSSDEFNALQNSYTNPEDVENIDTTENIPDEIPEENEFQNFDDVLENSDDTVENDEIHEKPAKKTIKPTTSPKKRGRKPAQKTTSQQMNLNYDDSQNEPVFNINSIISKISKQDSELDELD